MPEDRITRTGDPAVVRAALHLDDATAEVDACVARMSLHQKKALDLSWQIDALTRRLGRGWTQDAHGRLIALTARHDTEQKFLDRAHRALTSARRVHAAALDTYSETFARQGSALAEMGAVVRQRHRQTAAMARALDFVVDRALGREIRRWQAEGRDAGFAVPDVSHEYIPIGIAQFCDLLAHLDRLLAGDDDFADPEDPAQPYRAVSFLEVGCGPGRNLLYAKGSGLVRFGRMAGFDINDVLVGIGRRSLDLAEELQVGDALAFDYGGWDAIYSYRPIRDPALQSVLEGRIARTMNSGAYLLAPLARDIGLYGELEPVGLYPDIWKKTG